MNYRRRAIALVATGLGLVALTTAGCAQQPAPPAAPQTVVITQPAPPAPGTSESTSDTEESGTAQKRVPKMHNAGQLVVNLQRYDAKTGMVELIVPAPGEYDSGDWSEDPSNPGDFFVPLADDIEIFGLQKICSGRTQTNMGVVVADEPCTKDQLITALQKGAVYAEIALNDDGEISSMVEMQA
ncbi:hypothetical protein OU415_13395 [Saccharopolyspora sp. WRP15-2]|uniref:Uncharacterized protein n=1 Tax=Saccharopolyspora oryzae TaxID=2997343 RepID=A0ABT4UXJ9_9PSEU|nr:hypothetical protein [Saccharopolyspora oryzae]MDA3626436.1 hypothetical protein [Saccharopolyspora oryzae]